MGLDDSLGIASSSRVSPAAGGDGRSREQGKRTNPSGRRTHSIGSWSNFAHGGAKLGRLVLRVSTGSNVTSRQPCRRGSSGRAIDGCPVRRRRGLDQAPPARSAGRWRPFADPRPHAGPAAGPDAIISADRPASVANGVFVHVSQSRGLYGRRARTNAGPGAGTGVSPARRRLRNRRVAGRTGVVSEPNRALLFRGRRSRC